jgi:hypothetical protein
VGTVVGSRRRVQRCQHHDCMCVVPVRLQGHYAAWRYKAINSPDALQIAEAGNTFVFRINNNEDRLQALVFAKAGTKLAKPLFDAAVQYVVWAQQSDCNAVGTHVVLALWWCGRLCACHGTPRMACGVLT